MKLPLFKRPTLAWILAGLMICVAAFGQSVAPPSNNWNVQGFGVTGSAAVGNPVLIGGMDASGNVQPLKIASGGSTAITAVAGTLTDRSGTVTAGGTAQQLAAANTTRRYLLIQNTGVVDEWISFTTATPTVAGAGCYRIAPGGTYESSPSFVSNQAVYIFCATTGTAWSASEG